MIEWLTQYPSSEILSEWIQQMLRGLQQNDKNSVLIEIAHSTTEKVNMVTCELSVFKLYYIFFAVAVRLVGETCSTVRRADLVLLAFGLPALRVGVPQHRETLAANSGDVREKRQQHDSQQIGRG